MCPSMVMRSEAYLLVLLRGVNAVQRDYRGDIRRAKSCAASRAAGMIARESLCILSYYSVIILWNKHLLPGLTACKPQAYTATYSEVTVPFHAPLATYLHATQPNHKCTPCRRCSRCCYPAAPGEFLCGDCATRLLLGFSGYWRHKICGTPAADNHTIRDI